MSTPAPSPRIASLSWGRLELVDGRTFKDAKLYPGGAREWDWRETGTSHTPGIQIADVEELIERGAEVIVLSRGTLGALGIPAGTVDSLERQGIEVHQAKTKAAVTLYNRLVMMRAVAGLFHSTC
ncbi:MAG: Mth938-like domain-containing protein [Acidobacteriota bacterium]|nr:Mth938-like domain-containing protein [Acidobacteriota bacterium]